MVATALPHGFKRYHAHAEVAAEQHQLGCEWRGQQAMQQGLLGSAGRHGLYGYCAVCAKESRFEIEGLAALKPGEQPNWRETVRCEHCGLINRWRASAQLFAIAYRGDPAAPMYITEQVTPLYECLRARYPGLVGSEFVAPDQTGGTEVRWRGRRVRHEDATRLSFADASQAAVLSFDVLEHIPDYQAALREFARVLRPDGCLLLTAPFLFEAPHTLIRARLQADGSIQHLEPPVYHGDPINGEGVLCFQEFGWDLCDAMRTAGFRHVEVISAWAPNFGYYGSFQVFFIARR